MARGVHQCQRPVRRFQPGLLGENGNAPLPFQVTAVQKRVPVVHTPQHPAGAGHIEHCLRKRGLARVHMGHQPADKGAFADGFFLGHTKAPFPGNVFSLYHERGL